ncbi:PRTRC system ThiF family protein [Bacteroides acidifaciens]|jgi:PRTRC genetic system ThiF family protein|uniref:PRTRC system ThiF family protein n=1 Tax=Bacteroides acidifaciens TaxID=85831 RepID=UPI0025700754|nr:PRTRC system ThiF family protein [Bacteroides acidifaciens]
MKLHFTDNYIINPRHPITVNLIGAGGTGSQMLQSLARIDYALYKLGHPGLNVRVFDNDIVTEANIGRQLFSPNDVGLNKADVLVTRINTFFGVNWESVSELYDGECEGFANITITCVDNVKTRLEIGKLSKLKQHHNGYDEKKGYYWLDFGNQTDRGQVILGTIGKIKQPEKSQYETVPHLKTVHEMFDLRKIKDEDSGPSCSLAEALRKQDLFINSTLCQLGSALLWKLFSEGKVSYNGVYLNLSTMTSAPIKL